MQTVGSLIAGAVGGVLVFLLIEFIRRYLLVPRLTLTCKPGGKGFTPEARVPGTFTKEGGPEVSARYLRVAVENKSRFTKASAKSCRAYLTDIKRLDSKGSATETSFAETLRLRWAYEGPDGELHGGIDIPAGVTLYFDVVSSQEAVTCGDKHDPEKLILEVAAKDAREAPELINLLSRNSSYRLSVMVTAEGINPVKAEVDVTLGERWNDIGPYGDGNRDARRKSGRD